MYTEDSLFLSNQIFVAPDGRDSASGQKDAPLQTLEAALRLVKQLSETDWRGPVTIELRGGVYPLKKTLEISLTAPVTIRSYENEQAVFDGGEPIEGLSETELHGRRCWVASLPEGRYFHSLFVDGVRRPRAALPKNGFYRIKSVPGQSLDLPYNVSSDRFIVKEGDFFPTRNLNDVLAHVFHYWSDEQMPVKSFDPETRLMRGRLKDGKFQSPFNPFKWGDAFTEGNSWHWTWCVFHDPEGLIQLMGGRDDFNQMMDSVFVVPPIFDDSYYGQVIHEIREMQVMDMGNYAHGNQPIQHMVYLYAYSGQPWKTQYRVRQVMDRLYSALPDGYCGDEDNGQTSAWYVFSALGFYPVCPGSNQYVLGAPYFDQVKVHLENGNSLLIRRDNNNGPYVDQLLRDGVAYDRNYLDHEDLLQGLSLDFKMSGQPNLSRGTRPEDAPYSFSDELKERR